MSANPSISDVTTCRLCHETIGPDDSYRGYCFGCLLVPALDLADAAEHDANGWFDPYEILTHPDGSFIELGRGSMGITYKALDTTLQFPVALKAIDLQAAGSEANRDRFLREARAAARLRHPHVASVLYYGVRKDGQCFYAMELVEGETLAQRIQRTGPFSQKDALEVIGQVASALQAAEKFGLIHRDLKPANIMLAAGSNIDVKVIDFGLAKVIGSPEPADRITSNGFVGTPAFASPEQFSGEQIDQRSDYFSLGSTLFYLLSGKPPFGAKKTSGQEELGHSRQLPRLKALPVQAPVRELIASLLSPLPDDRPRNGAILQEAIAKCQQAIARKEPVLRRKFLVLAATAALVVGLALFPWFSHNFSAENSAKSIAVLPFDNLSPIKDDAYFADGIQDDILTSLAKVADLRVISRGSVQGYRDPTRRPLPRDIGQALHVQYLLNGSISREGNRIRVTAQLEEAQTGRQLWADRYDGELTDVFSIQAELAEAVSQELRAKLSAAEKGSLEGIPTRDFAAYELYLHAKEILADWEDTMGGKEPPESAARLLNEAVSRDPNFAVAWCLLARAHDQIYQFYGDRTETRRVAAEQALQQALRLRPDLGEVHLEKGLHLLVTTRDYPSIRKELEIAGRTLPNSPRLYALLANVDCRQGQWKEALQDFEKALSLDPRNMHLALRPYILYQIHRQYDETTRISKQLLAATPGASGQLIAYEKAETAWQASGDLAPLKALIDESTGPLRDIGRATVLKITCALMDRDFSRAEEILAKDSKTEFEINDRRFVCRDWIQGWIKYMQADKTGARMAFAKARPVQLAYVEKMPDDPNALIMLAYTDAALGRKEEAFAEGHKAVTLLPLSLDALEAPMLAEDLAEVYLWADEPELAMKQLESLADVPRAVMYGDLAKTPEWDSLQSNPRFQTILARVKQPIPILNRPAPPN
jgi:eukaryotic-like serine/threonine-protein kinase